FRINAEDPARGFFPQPGHITRFDVPGGPFVRVDAGVTAGDDVSPNFDSLIAKVIVWGADRHEAIGRGIQAMKETQIEGIPTLVPFHRRVLTDPAFAATMPEHFGVHTTWIETECTWLEDLAQAIPSSGMHEEIIRQWFEVDGKWHRLGFPASLSHMRF
ncbi:MAG: acetyl-/propionyl-CoA carboxylase subunit alpha, partial [Actinomycetia bacterium]|nr:acetyl-/propionyl-CoA carboxylase subunit alpha [Actinomycetes bacterium]